MHLSRPVGRGPQGRTTLTLAWLAKFVLCFKRCKCHWRSCLIVHGAVRGQFEQAERPLQFTFPCKPAESLLLLVHWSFWTDKIPHTAMW